MKSEQIRAIAEKAAQQILGPEPNWDIDSGSTDQAIKGVTAIIAAAISEALRDEWGQWQQAVGFAVTGMTKEQVIARAKESAFKACRAAVDVVRDAARAEGAREADRLRAWIGKYGHHPHDCDASRSFERECDCGLYAIRQSIRALSAAPAQPEEPGAKLRVNLVAGSGDEAQSEENVDFTPALIDPCDCVGLVGTHERDDYCPSKPEAPALPLEED